MEIKTKTTVRYHHTHKQWLNLKKKKNYYIAMFHVSNIFITEKLIHGMPSYLKGRQGGFHWDGARAQSCFVF